MTDNDLPPEIQELLIAADLCEEKGLIVAAERLRGDVKRYRDLMPWIKASTDFFEEHSPVWPRPLDPATDRVYRAWGNFIRRQDAAHSRQKD